METYYECECDWSENPDKKEWLLSGVYVFDEDENMMQPDASDDNIADEVMYYINQDYIEN